MNIQNTNHSLETSTLTRGRSFASRGLAHAALALAAVSFTAGCDGPGTVENEPDQVFILPDSDVSAVLSDADDNFVNELDDQHKVGASDCPQALGTVTVSNESTDPATATLELPEGESLAIDISSAAVEVAPGQSADISIAFNCMATDDIDTILDLSLEVDGRVGVFRIPLTLDVVM